MDLNKVYIRTKTKHAINETNTTSHGALNVSDLQNELGYCYIITKNEDILLCLKSIVESGLSISYDYQMDTNNVFLQDLLRIFENRSAKNENIQIISTLGMQAIFSKQSTASSLLANMYNIDFDDSSTQRTTTIKIRA